MPTSRHFGTLDAEADSARTTLPLAGVVVRVTIDWIGPVLTQNMVDAIDETIDRLDSFRVAALAAFSSMMDSSAEQPLLFWQFHRDEVAEHGALKLEDFVPALVLTRAGLYPDEQRSLVLDFVLRGPNTDQLLVAKFDRDGSLRNVSWES